MNAREYALDVLYRVFREHGFASLILRSCPLDEQETALAANMIYGTIRQYALLEAQWRPHVKTRVCLTYLTMVPRRMPALTLSSSAPASIGLLTLRPPSRLQWKERQLKRIT